MTLEQRLLNAAAPFVALVHDDGVELVDMEAHQEKWNAALTELAAAVKGFKVRCTALLPMRGEHRQCGRRATARVRRRGTGERIVIVPVCGSCCEKFVSSGWESV